MNISLEKTGDYTATIKIEMLQADYQENVNHTLKEVQKKSVLKGFRPGKVPMGLVRKMHERSVVIEQVNQLLSESLYNYLRENKLEIIGHPIENREKNEKIDMETQKEFTFWFDIGLLPEFNVELNKNTEVEYYDIIVTDEAVDEHVKMLSNKYGSSVDTDIAESDDVIKGQITELGHDHAPLENGISETTTITPSFIEDSDVKSRFVGAKIGDTIIFNPAKAISNQYEIASLLAITKEELPQHNNDFSFTIADIYRLQPAEIDEEFFKKVYPSEEVKTLEDFREKVKNDLKNYYQGESESYFNHMALEILLDKTIVDIPEDFLKRWLLETDRNLKEEELEKNMEKYLRSFKQELVLNRIAKDHQLGISEEDIRNHIQGWISHQSFGGNPDEKGIAVIETMTANMMKNEEEKRRIADFLFQYRLKMLLKQNLNLKQVPITYREFLEIYMNHHKTKHNEQ